MLQVKLPCTGLGEAVECIGGSSSKKECIGGGYRLVMVEGKTKSADNG